jgi:hypothetical protein
VLSGQKRHPAARAANEVSEKTHEQMRRGWLAFAAFLFSRGSQLVGDLYFRSFSPQIIADKPTSFGLQIFWTEDQQTLTAKCAKESR